MRIIQKLLLILLLTGFLLSGEFYSIHNKIIAAENNQTIDNTEVSEGSPEFFEPQIRNEIIRAEVLEIVEQGEREVAGSSAPFQLLRLKLLIDDLGRQEILLEHGGLPVAHLEEYQPGEQIFLSFHQPTDSLDFDEVITNRQASISNRARDQQLLFLFFLFMGLVVLINGFKGVRSLLSLILSFVVIFFVALPALLQGYDPSLVIMLLAIFIIPPTFYITHGVQRKTHVAVAATMIVLVVSSMLALTLINTMNLSGLATEEAAFLSFEQQEIINVRGLLLAGIILGLLGTLDDITVTQAGLTFSLKKNKPSLKLKSLFSEAMVIGQDHINSMVNTLVLVYTGASLPLLLLFINNPHPLAYVLSQEIVVEEIVRILVSSVGLIFAAPLTTFFASAVANWSQIRSKIVIK